MAGWEDGETIIVEAATWREKHPSAVESRFEAPHGKPKLSSSGHSIMRDNIITERTSVSPRGIWYDMPPVKPHQEQWRRSLAKSRRLKGGV